MAEIIPFKGILYNPEKIENYKNVVAPPYDVIPKEQQQVLHDRHPNNVVRLILGKPNENDTKTDNPHTRAANYFNKWRSEDILIKDQKPAFYLSSVDFTLGNKTITRYGLIALVKLEPFEKKIVLPHEKTFSKVKSERLELMKVSHANFSPIFSLYTDENNVFGLLKDAIADIQPTMDIVDDKGERHKLWKITEPSILEQISNSMKEKRIFIADGHHRYETALNYKKWVSEKTPDFDSTHPANYIMMYLCSMEDPGLVILPAHRILRDIEPSQRDEFINISKKYFDVSTISYDDPSDHNELEKAVSKLKSTLSKNVSNNFIGLYIKGQNKIYIMALKPGVMNDTFGDELPESLRRLDVTVLTRLIFMEILGFDQARLDNEKLISYSSNEKQAIEAVTSGISDMAFILNPTKIEQVRKIAEEGQIMPRKATYFYPKAITGQVMNSLLP